jgi:hypothetical protein
VSWHLNGISFRIALIGAGASIQDTKDELMWTGGDTSGSLTVKNAYMALISTQRFPSYGGWRYNIWKWDLQLKIKLFIWLAAENKILTWDILQQKGWEGPSRCQLCKHNTEDIKIQPDGSYNSLCSSTHLKI